MSSPTAIPNPTVQHPVWCSPEHCDVDAGHADVRHSTAPTRWQAEHHDVDIEVAVQRDDELVHGEQRVGAYGLVLRLQHQGVTNPDGSPQAVEVSLSPADMTRIEGMIVRYFELVGRGLVNQ